MPPALLSLWHVYIWVITVRSSSLPWFSSKIVQLSPGYEHGTVRAKSSGGIATCSVQWISTINLFFGGVPGGR